MNEKMTKRAIEVATPLLQNGERVVLADRRLLFFEETPARGRPRRELAAELPRAELRAKPARSLLYKTYHVTTVDGSPVLRLSFPLPTRGDANLLARELGSVES